MRKLALGCVIGLTALILTGCNCGGYRTYSYSLGVSSGYDACGPAYCDPGPPRHHGYRGYRGYRCD